MDFRDWIGKSETVDDVVTATPYAALSPRSTAPPSGRPRARRCRRSGTGSISCRCIGSPRSGPDGHAKRGGFLPPVPLPRRMWAGSQFEFHRRCASAMRSTRVSTIHDVTEKSGRTGPLVFVKVRHEIRRNGEAEGGADRVPRHRVSRSSPSPTMSRRRRRRRPRARVGNEVDPRRRAAVPLLRADLQRPPHPLRPALRDGGRKAIRDSSSTGR